MIQPDRKPVVDEEDHVVQKIPIVLSKGLSGKLFLFDYQREARQLQDVYTAQRVVKSLIKPKQQKVELHVELCKDSQNFNPSTAKKLASKLPKPPPESGSSQPMIESQILASSSAVSKTQEKFAVGVIHENSPGQVEIHINPLQGIVHLRQSYKYLDVTEKKEHDKKQEVEAVVPGKAVKSINVRFARQDPKRMKLAQAKSITAQQRLKDEEPWCETEYHKAESPAAKLEKGKMLSAQQESNTSLILVDTPESFLPVLCSQKVKCDIPENFTGPKSAEFISKLQFNEQVIARMKQAHMITFSKLKKYLDSRKADSEILSALQRAAVPVRGNWVVNSEHVFSEDYVSSCGIKAEQLCRARNHILYLFSKNELLRQKEVSQETGLPPKDVLDILKELAIQKKRTKLDDKCVGWRFKLPPDQAFLQRFPDEIARLETRFELKVLNAGRRVEEEESKTLVTSPAKKSKGPPRQRKNSTKSRKDSYSSDH